MAETNHFPDPASEAPAEQGYPAAPAVPSDLLPPGGGKLALPHYQTFSQIVNYASRTYRWTHDEALRHSHTNALAVRRDPVVWDALRQRQIPTVQLPWHLECEDDQDSRQQEAVSVLTDCIKQIPRLQTLLMHCLEALWFGRYGVQLVYQWDYTRDRRRLLVRDHKPINGDKLVFKYSGHEGVLVHATYPGTWQVTDRGRAHFFSPEEREQVIVHRHEPEDADYFEPELGGGVAGVGLRSRIYWLWWLRSQVTAFLMDYLERVGAGGFTIYFYEMGSKASLDEVKTAAENQYRNNTVLFPRYRDGSTGGPGVQRIEPSVAGAQLLESLIVQYFDDTIRRTILGQSQASDAKGAGLGSGISDFLEGNLGRLVKYDAVGLGETLTTDLVAVHQRYMFPDVPPVRFCFDVDKPNSGELLEAAQAFWTMGGTIDEDQLRSVIGLEKPQPGHAMLAKMSPMSPAAAGMVPEGVPMIGAGGPEVAGMAPQGAVAGPEGPPGQPPGAVLMAKKGPRKRYNRDQEAAFVARLKKEPRDATARLVYADWLEEQGREEEAHGQRLLAELAKISHDETNTDRSVAGYLLAFGNRVDPIAAGLYMHHVVNHLGGGNHILSRRDPAFWTQVHAATYTPNPRNQRTVEEYQAAETALRDRLQQLHPSEAFRHGMDWFDLTRGARVLARQKVMELGTPEPDPLRRRNPTALPALDPHAEPPDIEMTGEADPQNYAKRGPRMKYARGTAGPLTADPTILGHANSYLRAAGLPEHGKLPYLPLNPELGRRVADVYQQLKHDPADPRVRAAYQALQQETKAQFEHLQQAGVRFEPWTKPGQPYASSREMRADALRGHLYFFPTEAGFGQAGQGAGHPLLEPSGLEHEGRPLLYNDLFRAVHDYFGHALHGNEFGPRGEEHAYRTHVNMFTPQARAAMATETRGQNSWVNFGPHMRDETGRVRQRGEAGFLEAPDRPYAEQKAALLPDELTT